MDKNVRVGDKIIDKGRLFRIFKIKDESSNGERRKVVYFKPYFKFGQGSSTIVSMPLKNLKNSDIRKPVSKNTISEIKDVLKKRISKNIDTDELKDFMNENIALSTAKVAKYLWMQKKDDTTPFSLTKRRLLDDAIRSLSEEFAFVTGKKLESAEKTVKKTLSS